MGDTNRYGRIFLESDETSEALGVAGREARVAVPGYGGPTRTGGVLARPLAPGYGRFGKHQARGRVRVPGYGTAPIRVRVTRF